MEEVEQPGPGPRQVDRQHGSFIFPRQRHRGGRPRRIGEAAVRPAPGDPARREDHQAALGRHRLARLMQRSPGGFAGALGLHPLHGDQHLAKSWRDPMGVGVGVEHQIRAHRLQGVVDGDTVGDAGRVVAHHNQPARARNPLHPASPDFQRQQVGDMLQGCATRKRRDRIGHPPRLAIVQQGVEQRAHQGPGGAGRQLRRAFGDQDVDDVGLTPIRMRQIALGRGGGRDGRHRLEHAPRRPRRARVCRGARRGLQTAKVSSNVSKFGRGLAGGASKWVPDRRATKARGAIKSFCIARFVRDSVDGPRHRGAKRAFYAIMSKT